MYTNLGNYHLLLDTFYWTAVVPADRSVSMDTSSLQIVIYSASRETYTAAKQSSRIFELYRRSKMAAKKGRGLLMVFVDVPENVEDEFNRWYNEEHIAERLSIPGVLNAARYVAVRGGP